MKQLEFRWEPLSYLLQTGLAELGARSWDECGLDKETFKYDPDFARYGRMEQSDILRFMAVRDQGELIGYASVIVHNNLHDKNVCVAVVQDIFIVPEKRNGGTADKLMDMLESQLMSIKCQHISIASRNEAASRWLSRQGYHSNERIWTKSLRSIH